MAIAFGISLLAVAAGMAACALRGDGVTRDVVAWAITADVFYALFFWPGWLHGV